MPGDIILSILIDQHAIDMFYDWERLDESSVDSRKMRIVEERFENICQPDRIVAVLIGPRRYGPMNLTEI